MTVVDASAVLAFLQGEDGADAVERRLEAASCMISAANWSEVAQKVGTSSAAWPMARDLLLGFGVEVVAVGRVDAEEAAALWRRGSGLSLADRLCIALGHRLDDEVLSADKAWADVRGVTLIR